MKKILFATLLLGSSLCMAYGSYLYTSSCGEQAVTVGIEYFEGDTEEWQNYLKELDDSLCHSQDPVNTNT